MPKATPSTVVLSALLLAALCGSAAAQGPAVQDLLADYWQQRADYDIRCALDTELEMLTGVQKITYTNNSPDTLKRYFIHLYPNAWRDRDSKLYEDLYPGTWIFLRGLPEENRGWIEIDSMRVRGEAAEYSIDGTILRGTFARPLPPGGTAVFDIAWREKIRRRIGRAGYLGDHYDIAQWYPKMAVYDERGWHPDQFRKGEFYGEWGTYDVAIKLPGDYVIAATGLPVEGDPGWTLNAKAGPGGGGERASLPPKTVRFRAVNVHDFAWCADPGFVVEEAKVGDFTVRSFYRKGSTEWPDSALARAVSALERMQSIAGPYQWPQFSLVDSPARGGMEYPMLVMSGGVSEGLILHEVAHQWFYGMLANNERDEAWLDEGLAQFLMFDWVDERSGGRGGIWQKISGPVIDLQRRGFAEPMSTPYQDFVNDGRTTVYSKGALFFRALRYRVGQETFDSILREYFDTWKFRHVDEEALLAVCEDVSGEDLKDFFKQWVHSVKDCDYAVERFRRREEDGIHWADVRIKRKGEMITPLTLQFRLRDGTTVTERVDGMPREIEKSFSFDSRPASVSIDPDNEILDIYQLDNNSSGRWALGLENPWREDWPRASKLIELMPLAWYNDVDGIKGGLRLKSSYEGAFDEIILQGMYGEKSGEADFFLRYTRPVGWLGRETSFRVEGFYREGRRGGSAVLDKTQRSSFSDPMPKHWQFRFVWHDLFDQDYVFPGTYDSGTNLRAGGTFEISPSTDMFSSSLKLDFDRSFWGSDRNYEKFSLDTRIWPTRRFSFWLKPKLRLWYGASGIDPFTQERRNLAGAGPLEKEQYFWLRSTGAFPEDHYSNWVLPGNSNLRGYFDGDYAFKRTFAVNFELGLPFWVPGSLRRGLDGRQLYLFYDAGAVLDERPMEALPPGLAAELGHNYLDSWLQDLGVGMKIWVIKAEVPLWLSHPELSRDDDKWAPRWTIGIETLF